MDETKKKVEELWRTVEDKSPLNDWLNCFGGTYFESKHKAKREIEMALTQREYQSDPRRNFLSRLMSTERSIGYTELSGQYKNRTDLAMLFLQAMMNDSYWKDFLVTTLGPKRSEIDRTITAPRRSTIQHQWDGTNTPELLTTNLHKAARYEKVEEVKKLIKDKQNMLSNQHGYTPLHFAAMAINPKAEIAKLLIDSVNGSTDFLNKQTDEEYGLNTALHIAAANVNVSEEFIQLFRKAGSKCQNSAKDTPFHVAAKSRNPQTIIYMLNTFEPTNELWDMDEVDKGRQYRNTLINICAREGNAEAVALLIKHGADISLGVLHEIVLESVRNPDKITKLVSVYHTIVDNAVTWRCLEEKPSDLEEEPSELFRNTMVWLLTKPNSDYDGKDVIECAIIHGASAMFWQIINTKSVFRIDGDDIWKYDVQDCLDGKKNGKDEDEGMFWQIINTKSAFRIDGDDTWKYVDKKCRDRMENGKDEEEGSDTNEDRQKALNWTVFDVTNFTNETRWKSRDYEVRRKDEKDSLESRSLCSSQSQDENHPPRNFAGHHTPGMPYLTNLLMVFDHWKSSNILTTQPLKELTKPYITLIQRFYLILGLLQLIFMASFTMCFMPTTCSLAVMFSVSTEGCSNDSSYQGMPSLIREQRSWTAMLWVIWPIILVTGNVSVTIHYGQQARLAQRARKSEKRVLKSKDLRFRRFRTFFDLVVLRTAPLRIFCIMVFLWLYLYFWGKSHESYVGVTAMVLLFGWITNLSFLSTMSKHFRISALVVQKIIVKDIPSFMLFFGFTVVGFSFAMHTIRMSACMPNKVIHLHETFFAVLSSAFGIGDFFEATVTGPTCAGEHGTQQLFEFVYLGYVFATMIILLNVLIAMMNNCYEKAKRKAENIWRFEILSTIRALESQEWIVNMMRKCSMLNSFGKSMLCYVGCWYSDKNHGYLSFNKKHKRYYLRLLLPVDESRKSSQ